MNYCPTWGAVHNQKQYPSSARAMALEAGELMHQVYAAVRIWQLWHVQKLPKHAKITGERIFGKKRWTEIIKRTEAANDDREYLMSLAFATLHTSGWEDNPDDKTRTMTNMELSAVCYIDERMSYFDNWPIYVESKKKPTGLIGIEQVFDVCLYFSDGKVVRYIGTVDGLVIKSATNEPYLDENKTASRLDDGWRMSFDMAHQITGYCAASTVLFGFPVNKARVTGCKIRPTHRGEDVYVMEVSRDEAAIQHWSRWVRFTDEQYEKYQSDWEHAPRFTHSCNRYFRPCSLLAFCCDTPEGRMEQFKQMVPADKSPSERAIGD